MSKHRIGKDLLIRWRMVDKQGVPYDISKLDLRIEMFDFFKRKTSITNFAIENTSKIVFTFAGANQKTTGPYTLIAYINQGKAGQSVIDACNCFELVNCIHQETDQGLGGIAPEYEDLVSTIEVGIEGKSAYASWLSTGHQGTEADFVAWLREPSSTSATEITNLAEVMKQAESERVRSEEQRVLVESQRVSSESERTNAENKRVTDETVRSSNESQRALNEEKRKAEFARLKAESDSATANATSAASDSRASAEQANKAATNAQEAASIAQEYNDHQPIVGNNGNWWVWNAASNSYIDTNNPSRGDVCYPEFYVNDNMELHVRKPQSLPDGMFRISENGELILKV